MGQRSKILPLSPWAFVAVVVFGVFGSQIDNILAWTFSDKQMKPRGETVRLVHGAWTAHDPKWRDFDGFWSYQADFYLVSGRLRETTVGELASDLCRGVVRDLETHAADTSITKHNVYRFVARVFVMREEEWETPSEIPILLSVHNGRCIRDENEGQVFARLYGEMAHFELRDINLSDDRGTAEAVFFRTKRPMKITAEFDFLVACRALLADPLMVVKFEIDGTRVDLSNVETLSIRYWDGITAEGREKEKDSFSRVFDVSDGSCFEGDVRDA